MEGLGMEDVGIFDGHWKYFTVIWYIFVDIGIFFLVWVCFTKTNLATLVSLSTPARV
jgi:hypothetical protein